MARLRMLSGPTGAVLGLLLMVCVGVLGQGCPSVGPDVPLNPGDTGNNGVDGKYAGASSCELCHSRHHGNWLQTAHSTALETLESIGQGTNDECLPCHTVGFGEEGGFVDRATTDALAGVQCENCHGPAYEHTRDVTNDEKKPKVDISASLCGGCHRDAHQPTFEEYSESRHSVMDDHVAEYFADDGRNLNSCGVCHSGDYRQLALVEGETVADDHLLGLSHDELNPVVCATCHNPHEQTGNGVFAEDGHDAQLRYPEVAFPVPANTVAEATDPSRFNLCGQCHHSRGRTWDATSRGPHHSVQANMYVGEMPVPDGTELLVENNRSVHGFMPTQCVSCHMYTKDFDSEEDPAITGHSWAVNTNGCSGTGCHPSPEVAEADLLVRQAKTEVALADIAARLGDLSEWGYSSEGGPDEDGQAALPDEIKKIRFMYNYVISDGSGGVHNPQYTDAILNESDRLLTSIGK